MNYSRSPAYFYLTSTPNNQFDFISTRCIVPQGRPKVVVHDETDYPLSGKSRNDNKLVAFIQNFNWLSCWGSFELSKKFQLWKWGRCGVFLELVVRWGRAFRPGLYIEIASGDVMGIGLFMGGFPRSQRFSSIMRLFPRFSKRKRGLGRF